MKVLWLTYTASGAEAFIQPGNIGRGWIASLEEYVKKEHGITLGIAFFHHKKEKKFTLNGVDYYPILLKYTGLIGKIRQRLLNSPSDINNPELETIIKDFKPDIIHLFGTESGMTEVVNLTSVPIIVHLQGLVNPCIASWFPKGINQLTILKNSPFKSILLRRGIYFAYNLFKKGAKRELAAIKKVQSFFGRTDWDKHFIELSGAKGKYFHCDEILRPYFYSHEWKGTKNSHFTLITVINPQLYKGLETILEAAQLLKNVLKIKFKWRVIGISENSEYSKIISRIYNAGFKENNITLAGPKKGQDLIDELLKSDAFVHPSHIDNSPNSVCEAMLLGMPVIASNVGGIPSLITNHEDGILYNSFDPYELSDIIHKCQQGIYDLKLLGSNARARAIKRHNPEKITSTVLRAYKKTIENVQAPSVVLLG